MWGVGWNIASLQPVSTRSIIHINKVGKCTKTETRYLTCELCCVKAMSGVYRAATIQVPAHNLIYPNLAEALKHHPWWRHQNPWRKHLRWVLIHMVPTSKRWDRAAKTIYPFLTYRICIWQSEQQNKSNGDILNILIQHFRCFIIFLGYKHSLSIGVSLRYF